jgi:nucleotide-binding universal stress UspA family protein
VRMIIATDGSDVSIDSVRQAPTLLRADADLVLVTVIPHRIDPNEDATGFAGPVVGPDEAERIHTADTVAADAVLAATAAAIGPIPMRQVVLEGSPGDAICEFASSEHAALIVVGSHGKGFISKTFLGSVSSHVLANATCPVLVVRAPVDVGRPPTLTGPVTGR